MEPRKVKIEEAVPELRDLNRKLRDELIAVMLRHLDLVSLCTNDPVEMRMAFISMSGHALVEVGSSLVAIMRNCGHPNANHSQAMIFAMLNDGKTTMADNMRRAKEVLELCERHGYQLSREGRT